MNAVGIDAGKKNSVVAIFRPHGEVVRKPFKVQHTKSDINDLIQTVRSLDGDTKVVMEHTGHYNEILAHAFHEAGIFVCVVNPKLIKDYGDGETLHTIKTDKADAKKIANYTLDKWHVLKEYTSMDEQREKLKAMNRQMAFYINQRSAQKNNLISIIDKTYPGANELFSSPSRPDGHQKWVDFVGTYWHVDCVRTKTLNEFIDHYSKWCQRKGYNFSRCKAEEIYLASKELVPVYSKDDQAKYLVTQAVTAVNDISVAVESLRIHMDELASTMPEYAAVMEMDGVGRTLGPQLIAEIGDVTRFHNKKALIAFAGLDPGANQSSDYESKHNRTSKKGSPYLRKTLFLVVESIIKRQDQDSKVFQFIEKKRREGKPYYVCTTAGATKFLKQYYGKVNSYLESLRS